MAKLIFTVLGEGGTPFELPVNLTPLKVFLVGLETKSITVDISNPLVREVVFTQATLTITGPAKDKVSATLRFDNFTIPASGTFQNFLDVESTQAILEGEKFEILVQAEENITP
jgi:hypothetical protein